jgi:hypothetical protein
MLWCRVSFCRLLVVGALVALAGCSAGPPQDLRGPGRKKGEAFRSETKIVVKNGKMVMRTAGQKQEGTCDQTHLNVEDDQILEVEGGQVTKMETTVVSDETKTSVRVDGQNDDFTERGPLVGEKILRECHGDKWSNTLVGKQPNNKQQFELKMLGPVENSADLYPKGQVKPGHSWTIEPARLRKLFGPTLTDLSGSASMTFVKTTSLDGEPCALINFTMNIKGKSLEEDNSESTVELNVKGPAYRSLRAGYTIKSSLSGTMKKSGTVVEQGQRLQVEISGPVTIETVDKLK